MTKGQASVHLSGRGFRPGDSRDRRIQSRAADQISISKLLTLLFEITAPFDMTTRVELVGLQKMMVASRLESPHCERLHNRPPQSRIANTTIMVIAISLTVVAILCHRRWH